MELKVKLKEDLEEGVEEKEEGGEIRKPQEMAEPLSSVRQLGGERGRRLVTRGPKGHHTVQCTTPHCSTAPHCTMYNAPHHIVQCTTLPVVLNYTTPYTDLQ